MQRILVLMATFNGRAHIAEQVRTILGQRDVSVRLVVSDDHSTDGTAQWLSDLADRDLRVRVLPRAPRPSGSSAANFYRLIADVDPDEDSYVAFADQDDIWRQGKLAYAARVLSGGSDVDGVSSNVLAFYPDGRMALIRKDFPQRDWDFLCESPGPGSSFLITPRLHRAVAALLRDGRSPARSLAHHDWLVYAVCRAHGWRWVISGEPWVSYRQHEGNVMGANAGLASARSRVAAVRQGWHRSQSAMLAEVADCVRRPPDPELARLRELLADRRIRSRVALAGRAAQLRRRPRDRWLIGGMIVTGIW